MIQVCEIIENIRIIKDTPEIETMKLHNIGRSISPHSYVSKTRNK